MLPVATVYPPAAATRFAPSLLRRRGSLLPALNKFGDQLLAETEATTSSTTLASYPKRLAYVHNNQPT